MAIATLIAPFSRYSGSVKPGGVQGTTGGVVAMPDKNGRTITRTLVTPANPNTAHQQTIRAYLTNITEAYQSLSVAQVDAWSAIADTINISGRLGLVRKMTWTQLFQQVNSFRLQAGAVGGIAMDPPALDSATIPTGVASVASDDGDPDQNVKLVVTETGAPTAGSFLAIRFTRNLASPVRLARKTDYRYISTAIADSIQGRVIAGPFQYSVPAQSLNVNSGEYIGIHLTVLTPNFYPAGYLAVGNKLVGLY